MTVHCCGDCAIKSIAVHWLCNAVRQPRTLCYKIGKRGCQTRLHEKMKMKARLPRCMPETQTRSPTHMQRCLVLCVSGKVRLRRGKMWKYMKMGDPCHGYLVLLHSVKPDWRSDEDPEVVKLTRTLDAFQHFILQNSEEHQSSLIYKVYCIGENLAGSLMDVFRGISERRWTKLHEISWLWESQVDLLSQPLPIPIH